MKWMYILRKYAVWLSINVYALLLALWLAGWRSGLIKYPCMQPVSETMERNNLFISNSWIPTAILIILAALWLSATALLLDIRFGKQGWNKLQEKLIRCKAHIWLPIAFIACGFAAKDNINLALTILTWIEFLGFLAACSLLFYHCTDMLVTLVSRGDRAVNDKSA